MSTRPAKSYLKGEFQTALFQLSWGGAAILISTQFLQSMEGAFEQGLYAALLGTGILQIVKGALMYWQWNRLQSEVGLNLTFSSSLKKQEVVRIEAEMNRNRIEQIAEMLSLVVGLVLALLGSVGNWSDYYLGLGVGLMVQGGILIATHLFTGFRRSLYYHFLQKN